jgi:outer membrane protein assembly factor BamB
MHKTRIISLTAAMAVLGACGQEDRPASAPAAKKAPATVRDDGAVQTVEATGDVVQASVPLGTGETCGVIAHEGRVYVSTRRRLLAIDPATTKVVRRYRVPGDPCLAGALPGALLFDVRDRLVRLDLKTGRIAGSARADRGCGFAAVTPDAVWWTTDRTSQRIGRFAPGDLRPTGRVDGVGSIGAGPCDLAYGDGAVWAGNDDSTVQRIDPATSKVTKTFETGPSPSYLRWHEDGFLLVGSEEFPRLQVLDPEDGVRTTYLVGGGAMAVDGDLVYAASAFNGGETDEKPPPIVWRVDLAKKKITGRLRVGSDAPPRDPSEHVPPPLDGSAIANGSLWIVNTTDEALYRIDLAEWEDADRGEDGS